MRRWGIGTLLLLALAIPARAATWTCTKDFQAVQEGYYEVVGACAASGNYTTGGDPLGSAATASATAQALCHSNNQVLMDLVISPSSDASPGNPGLTAAPMFTFDHTNFKLQAFCPVACANTQALAAGAATISGGCVGTNVNASSIVLCTDQNATAAAVNCTPGSGTITMAGTGMHTIAYAVIPTISAFPSECNSAVSLATQKFRFRAVCK